MSERESVDVVGALEQLIALDVRPERQPVAELAWLKRQKAARTELARLKADSAALAKVREILAPLKGMHERATKGEWRAQGRTVRLPDGPHGPRDACMAFTQQDAEFIAAAHAALAPLLAAVGEKEGAGG